MKVFNKRYKAIIWVDNNYSNVEEYLEKLDKNGIVKMPNGLIVIVDELNLLGEHE